MCRCTARSRIAAGMHTHTERAHQVFMRSSPLGGRLKLHYKHTQTHTQHTRVTNISRKIPSLPSRVRPMIQRVRYQEKHKNNTTKQLARKTLSCAHEMRCGIHMWFICDTVLRSGERSFYDELARVQCMHKGLKPRQTTPDSSGHWSPAVCNKRQRKRRTAMATSCK